MKKITKGLEPEKLGQYFQSHPQASWEQFCRNVHRKQQVHTQIRLDQGGLCAYCEIDMKPKASDGDADFRVEHFHPKSDRSAAHNWGLDWQNLLGCCHGGSQSGVTEASVRFSAEHSCDVPKAHNIWDMRILNPLTLPTHVSLFSYQRSDGLVKVNTANCNAASINLIMAQNTIDFLNLNAVRLAQLRKGELDRINEQIRRLIIAGDSTETARDKLARAMLVKNGQGQWPKFFSAVRDYLGASAETQLINIGYLG